MWTKFNYKQNFRTWSAHSDDQTLTDREAYMWLLSSRLHGQHTIFHLPLRLIQIKETPERCFNLSLVELGFIYLSFVCLFCEVRWKIDQHRSIALLIYTPVVIASIDLYFVFIVMSVEWLLESGVECGRVPFVYLSLLFSLFQPVGWLVAILL